jgi:hypothetical protein
MMNREQICDALARLGHQSKYWGPDQSSYEAFAAKWPAENGAVPAEAELQAAWDAGAPERVAAAKAAANAPVLAQIVAKEFLTLRPMRELRRADAFGDVSADVVTAAKTKIKTLDDQITALRAQLQP